MAFYRLVLLTLLGIAALALPATGYAAKKVLVADCGVGGCRCLLSPLTVDEMELLTGEAAPPGAEKMTMVTAFDQMVWSPKSPKEIHGYFGGSGACPIELFPNAAEGPRDGVWEFRSSALDLSKCPMAAMFGAEPPQTHRATIAWGGRFDPKRFWTPESANFVQWSRIDGKNWRGAVTLPTGGPLSTAMRVRLINPVTIRGWNEVLVSDNAANLAGCFAANSNFTARWIGDG